MKKLLSIGIGFVLAIAVFAIAGLTYAQTQGPPDVPAQGAENPLHDYMIPAMAETFGLTDEQAAALELSRDTMASLRDSMSAEELRASMQQAFSLAVENALEDGAITQEQADQMLARSRRQGAHVPGMPGMQPLQGQRNTPPRAQAADACKKAFEAGKRVGHQEAIMRPYMQAAVADYLDVSVEELQQMHADGLTWQSYAQEQGLSDDEIADLRMELFTTAINNALEDGAITQEQADRMLDHFQNPGRRPGPGGKKPKP